jgi:phosphoglucomutase
MESSKLKVTTVETTAF